MEAQYTGVISEGEGRALGLGFPTINIPLAGENASGVYAGVVECDGIVYGAAIFADPARKIIEAHLLDFSGDLYGKKATIELHEKIRETEPFENDTQLKEMIAKDVEKTRAILEAWKRERS